MAHFKERTGLEEITGAISKRKRGIIRQIEDECMLLIAQPVGKDVIF